MPTSSSFILKPYRVIIASRQAEIIDQMAANLAVVASLLVALLALAEASRYTTITTTVVEEGNPSGQGQSQRRCSEQVKRQSLRQCSMYFSQRGSPYEMELEEVGGQSQQMRQCCQELRKIDQQCRCEAIREVVRRQQQGQGQGGQWQGEQQMQQVVHKAQNLPQRCNFQQPQQCQIHVVWF